MLKDYDAWKRLSPKQFESALCIHMKSEGTGFHTTRYTNDGGVDIEFCDLNGRNVIVQAKQYRSNVGVGVVRELVGVCTCRNDNPRVIIYALNGFTRGARELAEQKNIELRSIREDLLKI